MVTQSGLYPTVRPFEATLPRPARVPAHGSPTLAVSVLHCADHDAHAAPTECRYQVAWTINPHMAIGSVDFTRASVQHAVFIAALETAGATLVRLPFVHGAYDSVFLKDPALLLARAGRKRALLANFRHRERQCEREARASALADQGFDIVVDPNAPTWEGGDVVMFPSGAGMCLGHGMRTDRAAAAWLERHAAIPVNPLELTTPELYHLDMALSILPDGTALVCPWAITPAALRTLERIPAIRRVIAIRREHALEFGLNLVTVGDTVVIGTSDSPIAPLVASLGYRAVTVPLDEFHLAGGSAACLVSTLHPDPVA
jgi:N-dimethylarginine dimethylaminohydrolase